MLIQIKQLKTKVEKQRTELKTSEKQLKKFQRKEMEEQTQMALANINAGESVVINTNPAPQISAPVVEKKTETRDTSRADSTASQSE